MSRPEESTRVSRWIWALRGREKEAGRGQGKGVPPPGNTAQWLGREGQALFTWARQAQESGARSPACLLHCGPAKPRAALCTSSPFNPPRFPGPPSPAHLFLVKAPPPSNMEEACRSQHKQHLPQRPRRPCERRGAGRRWRRGKQRTQTPDFSLAGMVFLAARSMVLGRGPPMLPK